MLKNFRIFFFFKSPDEKEKKKEGKSEVNFRNSMTFVRLAAYQKNGQRSKLMRSEFRTGFQGYKKVETSFDKKYSYVKWTKVFQREIFSAKLKNGNVMGSSIFGPE